MTNSQKVSGRDGKGSEDIPCRFPVSIPRRGTGNDERLAFHAYMLLPGFSTAYHAATLKRSHVTIRAYRLDAKAAAAADARVKARLDTYMGSMRPEDGLQMARIRGKAQLPYWSRLAIFEYRKRGIDRQKIATMFRCSPTTVANILRGKGTGYDILSGVRRLTKAQLKPPACRWLQEVR